MFANEDDDDFTPGSSSNLFSIFNTNTTTEAKSSLSYKAPKQPIQKNKINAEVEQKSPENQSSVVLAKVINLWKSEQGTNKPLGKHMIAILGNPAQSLYEAIIYREKRNILIRQILNETCNFYKYTKNFMGFYDNHGNFWNINFNNIVDYDGFIEEVAKYKCNIVTKDIQNTNESETNVAKKPQIETSPVSSETNASIDKKSDILSRITKVGQAILPSAQKGSRETRINLQEPDDDIPSDSECTVSDSDTNSNYNHSRFLNQPQYMPNSNYVPNPNTMLSPVLPGAASYLGAPTPLVPLLQDPISHSYAMNNMLLAQNSEVKANLVDINMKLNTLMNLNNMGTSDNSKHCEELQSRLKCLNLKIANLSSDLEKYQKENTNLKRNYIQKCEELSQEHNRKKNTDTEIDKLKTELIENHKKIESLKSDISENINLIENQKCKLKDFEDYYAEHKNKAAEIEELKNNLEKTSGQLVECQQKYEEAQNQLEKSRSIQNSNVDYSKIIKSGMNDAFTEIMGNFDENLTYTTQNIQLIVLKSLKQATFNIIKQINVDNYENSKN